jgi:hypothetical protein
MAENDFPQAVKDKALKDAGNKCQCKRDHAWHRGRKCESTVKVECHHINANGPGVTSNCEVLCSRCHEATASYGRP